MKKIIRCGKLFTAENEEVLEHQVLVIDGNKITGILKEEDYVQEDPEVEIIDLSDKFVMPGLIDAHVHVCMDGSPTVDGLYKKLPGEVTINAVLEAQKDLMAGYTTIRDEGGTNYSDIAVKRAIDQKMVKGPRMFVSGQALTAVGGHGDSHFSPCIEHASLATVINGADEARNAARLNFKYGADQVKLFATGGVMSFGDEPGAAELTFEEMKAALDIAKSKGRISSAHAHGAEGIKNAIRAGITSIEHGMLIDEEAMEMMAKNGVYLIPTIIAADRIVEYGKKGALPMWMALKAEECLNNHGDHIRHMLELGVKIGFGSDAGCAFDNHGDQSYEFELMTKYGFTPAKALIAATRINAELMRMDGQIGTIKEGKFADLAAFDENPLDNIKTMMNCVFVMKDGEVYKMPVRS